MLAGLCIDIEMKYSVMKLVMPGHGSQAAVQVCQKTTLMSRSKKNKINKNNYDSCEKKNMIMREFHSGVSIPV